MSWLLYLPLTPLALVPMLLKVDKVVGRYRDLLRFNGPTRGWPWAFAVESLMSQCTAPRKMLDGGVDVELVGNPKRKV